MLGSTTALTCGNTKRQFGVFEFEVMRRVGDVSAYTGDGEELN
jgi:hypothetical protein